MGRQCRCHWPLSLRLSLLLSLSLLPLRATTLDLNVTDPGEPYKHTIGSEET